MTQSLQKGEQESFRTNNFDLIRIFAATQVLVVHCIWHLYLPNHALTEIILGRFSGVPIFFATSGFLISASFEKSHSLKIYLQNRILRIFPGLWCCVLVTTIVVIILGFNFFQPLGIMWLVLQFIGVIYTPAFLANFGFHSYNGSLWTIPIELQFYFVLPVLYYLQKKFHKGNWIFIAAFIIFSVIGFVYVHIYDPARLNLANEDHVAKLIRYSFFPNFYIFMIGVLFYKYKIYEHKLIKGKGAFWILIYLVFSFFLLPYFYSSEIFSSTLLGVTAISVAYTLPGLSKKIVKHDISYGVYSYHGLVLNIFVQFGLIRHWIYLPTIAIITYILGFLSWSLVEKRFIKMKKRSLLPAPEN